MAKFGVAWPGRSGAPPGLNLKQKISVKKAAELNDISEDSFRRHYSHLIRYITPRRGVVELGDAYALPPKK